MGILDTLGEVAGAVAAVEAAKKLDPKAGLLTEAAAAVAGFEGAGALESMAAGKRAQNAAEAGDQADDPQS